MADVLRIRRRAAGGSAAAPASLNASELAYNEQTDILYYGRGNSGGVATAVVPIAGPGAFLPLIGGSVTGGIDFGSALAPGGPADLSRHIALWGTAFGFSITSGRLNYLGTSHVFLTAATDRVTIGTAGITMASGTAITLAADPTTALQAATKQYVDAAGVTSFNTRTGAVTLTNADVTGVLLPASTNPLMNGTVAIGTSGTWARADHVHPIDTSRAPLASPTFTGTPAAPNPAIGDESTTLATTLFVARNAAGYVSNNIGDADATWTTAQANARIINATSALTADRTVTLPVAATNRSWVVRNGTTGGFNVIFAAGTNSYTIPPGYAGELWSSGAALFPAHNILPAATVRFGDATRNALVITTGVYPAGITTIATTGTGIIQFNEGIGFGNVLATTTSDLSAHIALWSTSFGFNVTSNRLNYVAGIGQHAFVIGGVDAAFISTTGLNATPVGATTPSTGAFTTLAASGTLSGAGFTSLLAPYAPLISPTISNPTFTGNTTSGTLFINGAAGISRIIRFQTAGVSRWQFSANGTAEAGSNAGTDLDLYNYDDTGVLIGNPALRFWRATGLAQFYQGISVGGAAGALFTTPITLGTNTVPQALNLNGPTASNFRDIYWQTAGVARWRLHPNVTAESGANAGCDLDLLAYDDNGVGIGTYIARITRSTGLITIGNGGLSFGTVVAPGGVTDLSRHIALYSTSYGINVTGGRLNIVSPGTIGIVINGTDVATFNSAGITANTPLQVVGTETTALANTQFVARLVGGFLSVALADADATWTSAQMGVGRIVNVSGALTADRTITVPIAGQQKNWVVRNSTTGGFNIIVTSGSTQIYSIPPAYTAEFWTNGANLFPTHNMLVASPLRIGDALRNALIITAGALANPTTIGLGGTGALQFLVSPIAPTPATADNSTTLATTAFVKAQAYAPLASPTFTGVPAGPTAAPGTSTTQFATTAFVTAADIAAAGVTLFNTRSGAITLIAADVTAAGGALLASPTFTGTPSAPTATAGTSTTQLATTAFVTTAFGSYAPLNAPIFTGAVQITGAGSQLSIAGSTSAVFNMAKSASGQSNVIGGYTGVVSQRWALNLGNGTAESGSNAGSDFSIVRYSDAGVLNGTPFLISRATGNTTLTGTTVTVAGNFVSTGTVSGNGAYINTSDRRLKDDIADTDRGLAEVMRLRPVSFRRKRMPRGLELGFIAQELREVIPEAVGPTDDSDEPMLGIMLDPIVAALVNGMKALAARVQQLEARTLH